MTPNRIKLLAYAGLTAYCAVKTYRDVRRINIQGAADREVIQAESKLDIEAINKAAEVVSDRIQNGQIRSIEALAADVRNEIDFQKIAIREED